MATIAPTKQGTVAFPKNDVIATLVAELIEVAKAEAQVRGTSLPPDKPKIIKAPIPMDSLSVVDTLCALEPVVGFELRESIVRTGGYSSIEAALEHLVPKIERVWIRKKGSKP
ncbi:MAG: hypothetical protein ACK4ZW_15680 [Blastomonas sp.]